MFTLDKKTGFKIIDPDVPVIINDHRNISFFDNSNLKAKTAFNLPIGNYEIISGNFEAMKEPLKFALHKLPKPERSKQWPVKFKIIFATNPHKSTIDWLKQEIIFDNALKNYELPQLMFIYYHEIAHAKYETEKYVDQLAENIMLLEGYNPSQISIAIIEILSNKQDERIMDAYNRNISRKQSL